MSQLTNNPVFGSHQWTKMLYPCNSPELHIWRTIFELYICMIINILMQPLYLPRWINRHWRQSQKVHMHKKSLLSIKWTLVGLKTPSSLVTCKKITWWQNCQESIKSFAHLNQVQRTDRSQSSQIAEGSARGREHKMLCTHAQYTARPRGDCKGGDHCRIILTLK